MRKLLLFACLFIAVAAHAQVENKIPPRPSPPRLVNDLAGLLQPDQVQGLERKVVAYNDSTASQIAIVIVNDLQGYEAEEYAVALGRKWGVGGKEFNNGVVILISTGGGTGNRDAFIATGYGLEGAIPDITARRIVDNAIIPNFREGNYYRGLDKAVDDIIKAAAGEYKAPQGTAKKKNAAKGIGVVAVILFIIIFSIIGGRGGGRGGMMSRRGYGDLAAGWIIGSLLGGGGSRGGGGGGGWSGGGGGGFGGFGGGSFGGGGAGGKW